VDRVSKSRYSESRIPPPDKRADLAFIMIESNNVCLDGTARHLGGSEWQFGLIRYLDPHSFLYKIVSQIPQGIVGRVSEP
jgi:hypothetical protein